MGNFAEKMEFTEFTRDLLGISCDFEVIKIEKEELKKEIYIYLEYLPTRYFKNNNYFPFYDKTPERTWQHLNWFEYKCYLKCSLPRYLNSEGKVVTIDVDFAPKSRKYTNKFSSNVILFLKEIRVQSTVAKLLNTTPYIVRSIMEDAVDKALINRGLVTDFKNVSLD